MKPILIFLFTCNVASTANYRPGPDAQRQQGVPKGRVIQGEWNNCQHFPGTERTYWVYIPAQYDAKTPANLMVF